MKPVFMGFETDDEDSIILKPVEPKPWWESLLPALRLAGYGLSFGLGLWLGSCW